MNDLLKKVEQKIWFDVLPPVIEIEPEYFAVRFSNRDFLTLRKLDSGYSDLVQFVYRKKVVSGVIVGWELVRVEDEGDLVG